jgi:hypothetical protein
MGIPLLIERLTAARLVTSQKSEVCPACGKSKKSGWPLCHECWLLLPRQWQRAIAQPIEQGYQLAMATAFRKLGRTVFIEPGREPFDRYPVGNGRNRRAHRVEVGHFSRELAARVMSQPFCVRCLAPKGNDTPFCPKCWSLLADAHATVEQTTFAKKVTDERLPFEALRRVLNWDGLRHAPEIFLEELYHAMRLTRGRDYHVAKEQF